MVKTELYELIQSMTMSEKRYFKIFSSKHVIGEKNDYVQLFDTLDSMSVYDEKDLKKQPFVKNLSAEKNYLKKLVLKSLVSFNAKLNTKVKVLGMIQNAEVLYHKGLYPQAEKQCRKAIDLADESELFTHKIVALELLVELISKQFKYDEAIATIAELLDEMKRTDNFHQVQERTMHVYRDTWKVGTARTNQEKQIIQNHINLLERGGFEPVSRRSEMYQLGLRLAHGLFINDYQQMREVSGEMTKLYESNVHLIEYSTIGYLASLYYTGWALVLENKYEEALVYAEKLSQMKESFGIPTSHNKGARVFFYTNLIRLDCLLKMDRYAEVEAVIPSILEGVNRFSNHIGVVHLYELYFQLAKYYFVIEEYRDALSYTNYILNDTKLKSRKDLLSVVRLLNLLIHFEMGNDFTLEYLTKNTFNYFNSKNRLFKVERELIKFMTGRNRDLHLDKYQTDLIQLRDAMRLYKKDEYEVSAFNHFDFEYWAQSKIEGKQLEEYGK